MAKIKIYKNEYKLPSLSTKNFQKLQENVQMRYKLIKGELEIVSPVDKILKRDSKPLDIDKRFAEFDKLVKDYESIIQSLQNHKTQYEEFFILLSDEIKTVVTEKCQEIYQIESKRLKLEQTAIENNDALLLDRVQNQQEQLSRSVKLLGHSALLILKKLKLFRTSLERLAEDQGLQKQVLDRMVKRLDHHRQLYQLQKEIDRIEAEVAEMANVAIDFEEFMRDYFGPFQDVLEQVTQVDNSLFGAVDEIKNLTSVILTDKSGLSSIIEEPEDDQMLEFLIQGNLKKDRLIEVLNRPLSEDDVDVEIFNEFSDARMETSEEGITRSLENIGTFIGINLSYQREKLPHYTRWWWNQLSANWKKVFKRAIAINHEPNDFELQEIQNLQKLNCDKIKIASLGPVQNLNDLKELSCNQTDIADLAPLESFVNMEVLKCNSTLISDIDILRKLPKLKIFECSNVRIDNIEVLAALQSLENINLRKTDISSLGPLCELEHLKILDCSETQIKSLTPLKNSPRLQKLYCHSLQIQDISCLKYLGTLQVLDCHNTLVNSLEELSQLSNLKELYCQATKIKRTDVNKFKQRFPNCQVKR